MRVKLTHDNNFCFLLNLVQFTISYFTDYQDSLIFVLVYKVLIKLRGEVFQNQNQNEHIRVEGEKRCKQKYKGKVQFFRNEIAFSGLSNKLNVRSLKSRRALINVAVVFPMSRRSLAQLSFVTLCLSCLTHSACLNILLKN